MRLWGSEKLAWERANKIAMLVMIYSWIISLFIRICFLGSSLFYSHFHVRIYSYFSYDTLVRISSLIKRERNKLHLFTYSSIHSLIHHHSIIYFFLFYGGKPFKFNTISLSNFTIFPSPFFYFHATFSTIFFHSISPLFFVTVQRTIKLKVVKCEF